MIQYQSVITCPFCGFSKEETMPDNACRVFYQCTHCKGIIKPKEGDCCVFCSYGSVPCPPIQKDGTC
ncbi:GDCCVxC domain-containing (seleno)protein [Flavihumibacter sp. ZG627]|uniref:GDCCVxC domain-containing (seleno)protein n=1 Tax=Flavihumibacter sp. ZG627 TaxID=1463156 RepID=UPI000907A3B0|nr:GDCCVxC domain-containing (seleno)protein [Flavihumibacter sp. ZG627]